MAEAVGLLAAAIGIGQAAAAGLKLAMNIRDIANAIKNAGRSLHELARSISLFSTTLKHVGSCFDADDSAHSEEAVETVREIVAFCTELFGELDAIIQKACVGQNGDQPSFVRRVKYYFNKDTVQSLLGRLENQKSTLSIMLQVLIYAKVKEASNRVSSSQQERKRSEESFLEIQSLVLDKLWCMHQAKLAEEQFYDQDRASDSSHESAKSESIESCTALQKVKTVPEHLNDEFALSLPRSLETLDLDEIFVNGRDQQLIPMSKSNEISLWSSDAARYLLRKWTTSCPEPPGSSKSTDSEVEDYSEVEGYSEIEDYSQAESMRFVERERTTYPSFSHVTKSTKRGSSPTTRNESRGHPAADRRFKNLHHLPTTNANAHNPTQAPTTPEGTGKAPSTFKYHMEYLERFPIEIQYRHIPSDSLPSDLTQINLQAAQADSPATLSPSHPPYSKSWRSSRKTYTENWVENESGSNTEFNSCEQEPCFRTDSTITLKSFDNDMERQTKEYPNDYAALDEVLRSTGEAANLHKHNLGPRRDIPPLFSTKNLYYSTSIESEDGSHATDERVGNSARRSCRARDGSGQERKVKELACELWLDEMHEMVWNEEKGEHEMTENWIPDPNRTSPPIRDMPPNARHENSTREPNSARSLRRRLDRLRPSRSKDNSSLTSGPSPHSSRSTRDRPSSIQHRSPAPGFQVPGSAPSRRPKSSLLFGDLRP